MIVSPDERCLQCRYSLEGLPSAHQCPECGLAFDAETIVFRRSFTKSLLFDYAPVAVSPELLLIVMIVGLGYGLTALLIAGLILAGAIFLYHLHRFRSVGPRLVALTKDAVVARLWRGEVRRMTYDEIAFARITVNPCVSARTRSADGTRLLAPKADIPLDGVFDNEDEARTFERRLNARIGVGQGADAERRNVRGETTE
ncbi:MAG: hypothetical protein KDA33_07490 [Phycisphaerales bacterium]|nr:hypothetical protein [Phycisphaerales bacterium]